MPFMVTFLSDGFEVADAAIAEAVQLNHGFKLSYIQVWTLTHYLVCLCTNN